MVNRVGGNIEPFHPVSIEEDLLEVLTQVVHNHPLVEVGQNTGPNLTHEHQQEEDWESQDDCRVVSAKAAEARYGHNQDYYAWKKN